MPWQLPSQPGFNSGDGIAPLPSGKNLDLAAIPPDGLTPDGLGVDLRYHIRSHVQHGGGESERLIGLSKYLIMKNYLVYPPAVAVPPTKGDYRGWTH